MFINYVIFFFADGSGHHYVALPLNRSTVDRLQSSTENGNCSVINSNGYVKNEIKTDSGSNTELVLKEEQWHIQDNVLKL